MAISKPINYLDFCDPAIKFFLDHPKKILLAIREYFQNFHTSSQTHITDIFVNCKLQGKGVLCYLPYRNLWR